MVPRVTWSHKSSHFLFIICEHHSAKFMMKVFEFFFSLVLGRSNPSTLVLQNQRLTLKLGLFFFFYGRRRFRVGMEKTGIVFLKNNRNP